MESEHFENEPGDGELRLENEIMKLRLHAEYGAVFPDSAAPSDDPESEYVFLKRVLQLHQRIAGMPPCPLGAVLDFSRFRPAAEIADGPELSRALEEALDYLEEANVIVDFECVYPDRLMYEFVTVELASLEVIGKPEPDEFICILYEAFHPNPRAELEVFCIDFFSSLIARELRVEYELFFSPEVPLRRLPGTGISAMLGLVERFLEYFPVIEAWRIDFDGSIAEPPPEGWPEENDTITVRGRLGYRLVHDDGGTEEMEGPYRIQVVRRAGLWRIADFDFYGFSWLESESGAG